MTDKPKEEIIVTVSVEPQYVSNEDMYIFPESGHTLEPERKKKRRKHIKGLGLLILIILLAAGAFCYFKFFRPQPAVQEIKTTSPIEKPVVSEVVERLAEKKEITPVELPPEVVAISTEKTEKAEEAVREIIEIETVEENIPEIETPVEEAPIIEIPVVETLEVETSVTETPVPEEVAPVTEIPIIEAPEIVPEVDTIEIETPVVSFPEVVKIPSNREELHTQAIENLPGDLKDIVKNL